MLEWIEVDIPAQTKKTSPKEEELKLQKSVITGIYVGFPDGCADYVYAQVWVNETQYVPWTRGEWLHWNNYMFYLPGDYPLDVEPYKVTVKGANLDNSYEHQVIVGVNWERKEIDPSLAKFLRDLRGP